MTIRACLLDSSETGNAFRAGGYLTDILRLLHNPEIRYQALSIIECFIDHECFAELLELVQKFKGDHDIQVKQT
jgi:hypothetical protein